MTACHSEPAAAEGTTSGAATIRAGSSTVGILSLGEVLEDEWFRKHLDYVGFLMEVRHSLGDVIIRTFCYSDTVMSEILRYLGAGDLECGVARHNESLHRQGLEMMRIVNRYRLEPEIRDVLRLLARRGTATVDIST